MTSDISNPNSAVIPGVYYVESSNMTSHPYSLIAIRPTFEKSSVSWEDTSRGIHFPITSSSINIENAECEQPPKRIEIISDQGENLTLHLLTKKYFEAVLQDSVACGRSFDFKSDEEVQSYYLNTSFD